MPTRVLVSILGGAVVIGAIFLLGVERSGSDAEYEVAPPEGGFLPDRIPPFNVSYEPYWSYVWALQYKSGIRARVIHYETGEPYVVDYIKVELVHDREYPRLKEERRNASSARARFSVTGLGIKNSKVRGRVCLEHAEEKWSYKGCLPWKRR